MALGGEGVLFGEGGLGDVGAGADQGVAAEGESLGGGGRFDLGGVAERQPGRFEVTIAIDRDLDLAKRRRLGARGSPDRARDGERDRGQGVAGKSGR